MVKNEYYTQIVVYAVIFTRLGPRNYMIHIPDFFETLYTESIEEGIGQAREWIGREAVRLEKEGMPLPEPASPRGAFACIFLMLKFIYSD